MDTRFFHITLSQTMVLPTYLMMKQAHTEWWNDELLQELLTTLRRVLPSQLAEAIQEKSARRQQEVAEWNHLTTRQMHLFYQFRSSNNFHCLLAPSKNTPGQFHEYALFKSTLHLYVAPLNARVPSLPPPNGTRLITDFLGSLPNHSNSEHQ
ncbi:hypothetical protein PAPYR_7625 [Paratrimastix pyriformis]|uniref:Uncharacterized protein n=1 Tax=Paratrimastix pyriformis TaxID=342808 RepID=A0ABQ8UCJ4_9EUKA|nr:hypothetical protein PAPYR_7625 [Paratrimastix pyriformis]